jgi:Protein of unknown function (DUF2786)
MSQRDDVIKKIKSLLAKTTANGCTEAEAITAAEHAAKLLEQYDLTFEDVEREIREQKFKVDKRPFGHETPSGRRQFPAAWHCMMAIADFFDCKSWYSGVDIVFFGTEDETGLAHSMLAMLDGAVRQETDAYLARTKANGHGKTLRASFEHGITDRLSERLTALKRTRTEADQKAHESLATVHAAGNFHAPVVVAKQLVVTEKFKELGIRLSSGGGSRSTGSHSAYRAGQTAGERVSLSACRGLLKS